MNDVMIEAKGLSKNYGPVQALKDASFTIRRGEVVGFLGPNGAGKTTTMKILTSFIAPSSGNAAINGADVINDSIRARQSIGYLPENTPLYTEMLALEYLQFVAEMRGLDADVASRRIRTVVDETSLGNVLGKTIGELSKGYRQRVGLAQALLHEPPVLILDEPMTGLDPNQAVEIRELIREIGKERTVILSTHNLAEVRTTCSRVLIINEGQVVADDTPAELEKSAGKPLYKVVIRTPQRSMDDVLIAFDAVPGVEHVEALHYPTEIVLHVRPSSNEDLREQLFRVCVREQLALLGLEVQGETLEDVFRALTHGQKGAST
ncbi:MAG: ATP-binding cassette domain-containing protein [Polyangiales bacterium]